MGRGRLRHHGEERPTYFPGLREVVRADLYPLVTGVGEGLTTRDVLRAAGLSSRERPDLLVGGPPCVAFSKSGFWLDWKRDGVDPAASLLQAYTRVLAEARPRYFILENVYALTFNNKASRPAFTRLLAEIEAAGYRFRWQVLNAADFGVPQDRPRLCVVGCRKRDTLPDLPDPTQPSPAPTSDRSTGTTAVCASRSFAGSSRCRTTSCSSANERRFRPRSETRCLPCSQRKWHGPSLGRADAAGLRSGSWRTWLVATTSPSCTASPRPEHPSSNSS